MTVRHHPLSPITYQLSAISQFTKPSHLLWCGVVVLRVCVY